MIVIFTGCDRSGKTTLTNAFIEYSKKLSLDVEYKHFCVPTSPEQAKQEYFDYINSVDNDKLYVLDRFYESEYVYAPIYRNYSMDYLQEIEQLLNQKDVLFVYMQTPFTTIYNRLQELGDEYIDINDIQKICNSFEMFFATTTIPYITISGDYNLEEQTTILQLIYSYIDKLKRLNKFYVNKPRSMGKLNSEFIIVNLSNNINIRNINDYMYQWISNKDTYQNDLSILDINSLIFHIKG